MHAHGPHGHDEEQAHSGHPAHAAQRGAHRHDHGHGHAHGHGHGHGHSHAAAAEGGAAATTRALALALGVILLFAAFEFVGGLWSGSLALLADAGHMVTDAAALGFSLFASIVARRPVSARHSYGLARTEVIAAFVNSLALLAVVAWLLVLGVDRVAHPVRVNGEAVSLIAGAGIVVNVLVAWVLARGQRNLNVRAAMLHVLGDLLGSIAALVAGLVILYTGYSVVDPLLSMLVSGLILRSTFGVLRESTLVLLDSVPADVDLSTVGRALAAIPGVVSVHDLHIWAMVPGQGAVSAHLLIERIDRWPVILMQARQILRRDHGIEHVTLQPECFARASGHATIPLTPVP